MKYEISAGFQQLYCPEDSWEAQLVFDMLDWKMRGFIPYFVERDRDYANEYRNGAWYAWPFELKGIPGQAVHVGMETASVQIVIPTIFVDVALPVNYAEERLPVTRWSSQIENDFGQQSFTLLIQKYVDPNILTVRDEDIFSYLPLLKEGITRLTRVRRIQHGETE